MGAPINQAGGLLSILGMAGLLGTVAYLIRRAGNDDNDDDELVSGSSQSLRAGAKSGPVGSRQTGPKGKYTSTLSLSQPFCSECGIEVGRYDTACSSCGASRRLVCAQCGAECPREKHYCPKCGSKVAIGLSEDR